MKLRKLSVRGYKGLRAYGEEFEIDFGQFSPGPIALQGDNGSGKTSFIEILHPYRTIFSRSDNKASMAQSFYLPDSRRFLEFEYGGFVYQSDIRMKANGDGAGDTEAYLFRDGVPLNKEGNTRSYDREVERIFGPLVLFRNSVFSKQDGDKIFELEPAAAKTLFLQLAGEHKYAKLVEIAKKHIRAAESDRDKLADHMSVIVEVKAANEAKLGGRAEAESKIAVLTGSIAAAEAKIAGLQEDIRQAAVDAEKRRQSSDQIAAVEKAIGELAAEKAPIEKALADYEKGIDEQIAAKRTEIAGLEQSLAAAEQARASAAQLEALRAEEKGLDESQRERARLVAERDRLELAIRDELEPAREELRKLDFERTKLDATIMFDKSEALAELKRRESELTVAVINERNAIKNHRRDLDNEKVSIEQRIKVAAEARTVKIENLLQSLKGNRGLAEQMGTVACKDAPEYLNVCPLLATARTAGDEIPGIEERIRKLEAEDGARHPEEDRFGVISDELLELDKKPPVPASQPALEAVQSQIKGFATEYRHPEQGRRDEMEAEIKRRQERPDPAPSQGMFDEAVAKIAAFSYDSARHLSVMDDIAELSKTDWAAQLAELEAADQKISDRRRDIAELEANKIERGNEYRARVAAIEDKATARTAERNDLEGRLAALPDSDADTLALDLELAKGELDGHHEDMVTARSSLAEIDRLGEAIAEQEAQLKDLGCQRDRVLADLTEWQFLETACGIKSGIPVLKLDTMAPEIAGIAMDILRSYGRDWVLKFVTARPSADGKGTVETMDIDVTREVGTDSIKKLCGGEKLMINHCLRQAITIYLRRNSGRDYRMVCYDESDGALSPEAALVFLKAINRTHDLSGAVYTFLITHREALWLQIPQRIHFKRDEGKIEIVHEQ